MFWGFEAKQLERLREVALKYEPTLDPARMPVDPLFQKLASEYKRWDTWGPGARAMAEEAEALDTEAWGNFQPIWTHEILFFLASCFLHPTPIGLRERMVEDGSALTFGDRDEEKWGQQALVTSAALITHLANRMSLFWGLGLSDGFAGYWEKYIRPFMGNQSNA
jgi:hypothetical protein